jgi:hypothetical protein
MEQVSKPGSSKSDEREAIRLFSTPQGFQNTDQGRPRSGRTLGRRPLSIDDTPKGFQNGKSRANASSGGFCNPFRVGFNRLATV